MVRNVYRNIDNKQYWDARWREEVDGDENFAEELYPIKYANMVCGNQDKILEIGVGGGRVFNYYKRYKKFNIYGIESSQLAVDNLISIYPSYSDSLSGEDCLSMSFDSDEFDTLLAFGVYHNFDSQVTISDALLEAKRVAKDGAKFCISLRPNNFAANFNEWLWHRKNSNRNKLCDKFHRMLMNDKEAALLLKSHGFIVNQTFYAQNYPILRKIKFFRKETLTPRLDGYKLNKLGEAVNFLLSKLFKYHMCNIMVFIGVIQK